MSSSIWTRCGGDSEVRPLRTNPWRVVESQHFASTRKLVHTLAEQSALEELIEGVKPRNHAGAALHYLLSTPFRYPPLLHGSRFATRYQRGIWYGSETQRTAFAEVAYYRMLFLEGTRAELGTLRVQLTAFRARARSRRGVDLVLPPFAAHRKAIASRSSYAATQALGEAMRAAGVELFRYPSARDSNGGVNVGIFSPTVFGGAKPHSMESWTCLADRDLVELARADYFRPASFSFARAEFLVSGALPAPAP